MSAILDFHLLRDIDPSAKCIVVGYIRKMQVQLFPNENKIIPSGIKNICLLFFYETQDCFDTNCHHHTFSLSSNNLIITKNTSSVPGIAYLSNIVRYGIYSWRFQLLQCDRNYTIPIGVWKINHPIDLGKNIGKNHVSGKSYAFMYHFN
eukprot:UN00038